MNDNSKDNEKKQVDEDSSRQKRKTSTDNKAAVGHDGHGTSCSCKGEGKKVWDAVME